MAFLVAVERVLATLHPVVLDTLALLLPVNCAGCGAADRSVCARCRAQLAPEPQARVLDDGTIVVAGLRYEGIARECIIGLKQRGRTDAARPLAPALAAAVSAALAAAFSAPFSAGVTATGDAEPVQAAATSPVLVCAIPSRAASVRARGYSPVSLLCRRGLGILPRALLRLSDSGVNQKTLGVQARRDNIGGTLHSRYSLAGQRVLIVDDVVTTGATILDAARAIREAGGYVVAAAVVADTPLRIDAW